MRRAASRGEPAFSESRGDEIALRDHNIYYRETETHKKGRKFINRNSYGKTTKKNTK